MKESFPSPQENSEKGIVTKDMLLTLYGTSGNETMEFKEALGRYAAQLEAKSMANLENPGLARLICSLELAELYVEIGFIDAAYENAVHLSDVVENEVNGIELLPRINALLRIKSVDY